MFITTSNCSLAISRWWKLWLWSWNTCMLYFDSVNDGNTVFFCPSIHLCYPHPVPSASGFNSRLGNPSKIAMLVYKHADIGRVRNLWGCLVWGMGWPHSSHKRMVSLIVRNGFIPQIHGITPWWTIPFWMGWYLKSNNLSYIDMVLEFMAKVRFRPRYLLKKLKLLY